MTSRRRIFLVLGLPIIFATVAGLFRQHHKSAFKKLDWVKIERRLHLTANGSGTAVAWSSDEKYVVAMSAYGSTVSIWDLNGTNMRTTSARGGSSLDNAISFLDSNRKIVSPLAEQITTRTIDRKTFGIQTINVWDAASARAVASEGGLTGFDSFALFSQRQLGVAIDSNQRSISVLSLPRLNVQEHISTSDFPKSLAFFPDGNRLAIGFNNGASAVLDLKTKKEIWKSSQFSKSVIPSTPSYPGVNAFADIRAIAVNNVHTHIAIGTGLFTVGLSHDATDKPDLPPDEKARAWAQANIWASSVTPVAVLDAGNGEETAQYPGQIRAPIWQVQWHPQQPVVVFSDSSEKLIFWKPFQKTSIPVVYKLGSIAMSIAISPSGNMIAVTTSVGVDVYNLKWS